VQALSASLAGSDFSHHRNFIDTAERYRRNLVNRMNADGMVHEAKGADRHVNDARLWASIPDFAFMPPRLGKANAVVWPAAVALLLWVALAMAVLWFAARRLRP
jgi:ABC-2 type transport system permease protein